MQLSLKNTTHASSFRSKLFASLKRFVRACPVQCQYLIPTVLNLWQCHPPTFLRLLPGQWITSIYFPIHGLKPSIIPNFPWKLHAVKLFPKSCFTIDLTQMKWYIKGAPLDFFFFCDFCDICHGCFQHATKILVTFAIFAIFADISGPFLASLLSKSWMLLYLLFLRFLRYLSWVFLASKKNPCYICDFCDICGHFGVLLGYFFSKSWFLLDLLFLRFLRYFLVIFSHNFFSIISFATIAKKIC